MNDEAEDLPELDDVVEVEKSEEMSEANAKILVAFESAIEDEKDEDEVKMAMLMAGCKFKKVNNTYTLFMTSAGLIATKEEKTEALVAVFEDHDVSTEDGFDGAVAALVSSVNGATEGSAAGMIRAFCKKSELEFFKKPKGAARTSGFKYRYFKALRENPNMDEQESDDLVKKLGSPNDYRYLTFYQTIRQLCNDIASDHS